VKVYRFIIPPLNFLVCITSYKPTQEIHFNSNKVYKLRKMAEPLLTTLEVAKRLEEVDVIHTTRQIEACAEIFPEHKSFTTPIDHGVVAITLPKFGRKLNRATGFGMGGPVSEEDLITIENIFNKVGIQTEISMCPFAHPSSLQVLAAREYTVESFMNFYVRVLIDEDLKEMKIDGVEISRVPADNTENFPSWSLAGYKDGGRAEFLLETVGRIAATRNDTTLYMATVNGKVAGSAAMASIRAAAGTVAHLYIDSTLPHYRGRGIQGGLLRARLADARRAGFDFASIQARPSNHGSCKNIERAGFSLAYTKTWFQKA
jgi:GNAT superfamily N-acetyltransferase